MPVAYLPDLGLGYFCVAVTLSLGKFRPTMIAFRPPSFLIHVIHIVLVSAKEEVVGPNAGRIVTAMADKESVGYRPIFKFPCHPVGYNRPISVTPPEIDMAVPATDSVPRP